MKTLLLVRHAKSSHSAGLSSDFDRPLNDRGFREAAEMGKKLFKNRTPIDQFVSSPALRAKTTAELFADEYHCKMKEINFIPSLYDAAPDDFLEAIQDIQDNFQSIALFSHNPGITEFASSLTNTHITQMPTCSVFAVSAAVDSWKEFAGSEKKFLFFYRPE
jgi:phosphohistidine phosphatase